MASLAWVGGVSNEAADPLNWSGGVLPAPGDFLSITGGTVNVIDDEMAGNTIYVEDGASPLTRAPIVFNINNNGFLDQNLLETTTSVGQLTWNVAAGMTWTGGYGSFLSPVTVNGPGIWENGMSGINGALALINTPVIGSGQFYVLSASGQNGVLAFESSVAAGQAVAIGGDPTNNTVGILQLDDPAQFQGSVTIGYGEILLNGVIADSYSYDGSTLSLFSGSTPVDTLRLTQDGTTANPVTVSLSQTGVEIHTDSATVAPQALGNALQSNTSNQSITFIPSGPSPAPTSPFSDATSLSVVGNAAPASGGDLFADPTRPQTGFVDRSTPADGSVGLALQNTPEAISIFSSST